MLGIGKMKAFVSHGKLIYSHKYKGLTARVVLNLDYAMFVQYG